MGVVLTRCWSRRRAEQLASELGALKLLSPPDPKERPIHAPREPDPAVFYAYRPSWRRRWQVRVSLHWMGEYQMDFDSDVWKVRFDFGVPAARED